MYNALKLGPSPSEARFLTRAQLKKLIIQVSSKPKTILLILAVGDSIFELSLQVFGLSGHVDNVS